MTLKSRINYLSVDRGCLYVPTLSFKPFHVAISERSHVAIAISSNIGKVFIVTFKKPRTL